MKTAVSKSPAARRAACSKLSRLREYTISIALVICLVLFVAVSGSSIFANRYGLNAFVLVVQICIVLGFLYSAGRFMAKHPDYVKRHYWKLVCAGILLLLAVNIIFGLMLRYRMIFDFAAIHNGAIQWLEYGNFTEITSYNLDPLYYYNLGAMTLLHLAYRGASALGWTDYYAVGMTLNSILVALTVFLATIIARRIFKNGRRASLLTLLSFLVFPSFYFISAIFYTDSLSMAFPLLILYWYLRFLEAEAKGKRHIYMALMGLCAAIGALIKLTVVIALIAVIIHYFWQRGILRALCMGAITGLIVAAMFFGLNQYMYANHLDREKSEALNTPYTHWIMMGLKGDGYYNGEDYVFTRSFENNDERNKAIREEIVRRIEERGFLGMLDHLCTKGGVLFGDGTFNQPALVNIDPAHDTFLHTFLPSDGEYSLPYKYIASGTFFSFLVLICMATFRALRTRETGAALVPILSICGITMFLLMWEVTNRYITNFVPMMLLCAAGELSALTSSRRASSQGSKHTSNKHLPA